MPQGMQAKILSPEQEFAILCHLESTRYPARDYLKLLWVRDSRILKP